MQTAFAKYEGAGNDFILIDNRDGVFTPDAAVIARLCDRHFGIGTEQVEELAAEAHAIIDGWKDRELTREECEIVEHLKSLEENPYPNTDIE